MVWPSIVNMWKSLAYSLLNREQKHRVLSVHSGICSIPLAVGILSKLDYGDKGSPALPKDSRVKYNTGDSYKYDVLTPSGLEFSLLTPPPPPPLLTLSRLIIIVSIFQYLAHGGYLRSQILRGVLVNPPGYSISPSKSCILQLPSIGYSIDYN